jgi:hypothetical protein
MLIFNPRPAYRERAGGWHLEGADDEPRDRDATLDADGRRAVSKRPRSA